MDQRLDLRLHSPLHLSEGLKGQLFGLALRLVVHQFHLVNKGLLHFLEGHDKLGTFKRHYTQV
jgi:hypothetical protein